MYVEGAQKNHINETILFEHQNHMLKLMCKEINSILGAQTILNWTYVNLGMVLDFNQFLIFGFLFTFTRLTDVFA